MSSSPLRLLLVEDSEDDAALVLRELRRGGYEVSHTRVESAEGLEAALDAGPWDVIITDYALPGFDGLAAFAQVRARGLDVPFLIVSGKIGEDVAVAAMKAGVHDFVLKDRMGRLAPAVAREIREAEVRAERRRIQEHLLLSDRLSSLGLLAASVAHEINNPLASLIMNLQLVMDSLEGCQLPGEGDQALREAFECAGRVRDIIRDIKVFSRPEERQTGPTDLHRVLDSCLRMASNHLIHRARVTKEYGQVLAVLGSEARLGQVFLNLIVNAAQALPDGQKNQHEIRVATKREGTDFVRVEIHDTGPGIPVELQERIFEPFFTTKPTGVGTGLGLSICRRLITEMGGTVGLTSQPGKGTTFWVRLRTALPVADSPPDKSLVRLKQGMRVLVIDDEAAVGRALQRYLGRWHDISVTLRAREALGFITAGAHFDAILCDLMMPEMNGPQFHEALRRVDPEQARRVIFMTGGAFSENANAFLSAVPNPHLEKPIDLERLGSLLDTVPQAQRQSA
jgi:signal transduction histidine kinase